MISIVITSLIICSTALVIYSLVYKRTAVTLSVWFDREAKEFVHIPAEDIGSIEDVEEMMEIIVPGRFKYVGSTTKYQ